EPRCSDVSRLIVGAVIMSKEVSTPPLVAVILAGGSGTRFWPRSRKTRAKQVLTLSGETSMIQQTVERLLPVAISEDIWVLTNDALRSGPRQQPLHGLLDHQGFAAQRQHL